jgi:osmoprotectant transport system permease protein
VSALVPADAAGLVGQVEQPLIRWDWIPDHAGLIWSEIVQHLWLTVVTVGIGFAISMVLALIALRFRITFTPINLATGIMYAIPSLALFVLLAPIFGLGTLTAEIALISYTLQIITRSIVAGIDGVSPAVRESATGMGYTDRQRLWRVEVPLALPVIMGGLRIATVTTVGLLPVAGILGSDQGGLGQLLFSGLQLGFNTPLLVGGALIIAVAVACDLALVALQRQLTPWTHQRAATA